MLIIFYTSISIGSQLRLVVTTTNSGLAEKNNGNNTKKLAHEYEPIFQQNNENSFHLPPSSQNQSVWMAALAFIIGVNIGGAYIYYNSKIKKNFISFDDLDKSIRSKKRKYFSPFLLYFSFFLFLQY